MILDMIINYDFGLGFIFYLLVANFDFFSFFVQSFRLAFAACIFHLFHLLYLKLTTYSLSICLFKKTVLYFLKECLYKQHMFLLFIFFVQIFRLAFFACLFRLSSWNFNYSFFILLTFFFLCSNLDIVFSFCEEIDKTKIESLVKSSEDSLSEVVHTSSREGIGYFTGSIVFCCLTSFVGGFVPACCIVSYAVKQVLFVSVFYTNADKLAKIERIEELQVLVAKALDAQFAKPNSHNNTALFDFYSYQYINIIKTIEQNVKVIKDLPFDLWQMEILQIMIDTLRAILSAFS